MSDQSTQSDGISTLRSATIRLRSDIQWIAYPDTGRWVAMDPISNAFYYFSGLEHQAVLLLDGTRTVDQVFEAVRRVGLKSHLSATWIETLVQKLFRTNLIDTPPGFQTGQLATSASRGSFFKSVLANPLSVRIPLFRPSIDYAWARLFSRVFFSPKTIIAMAVALLSVSYFVASKLLSRPSELLYDVGKIQGDRWLVLGAVLVAIKSIHELGHYLACVHLKVRCAEIGALFLCFTPCLYCDTTESWRLPSRWHRAGIAAAGIYMEFWIAILGGLIFLNTQNGLLHVLGGGMWVMCTLGTLVLNANPFFRYDGYFILSDVVSAPNLGAQSSSALWHSLVAILGGRKPDREEFDLPIALLSVFAFLSMLYRWVVLGSIVFFLWHFLVPSGLGFYFIAIGSAMALGIVKGSMVQAESLAAELFAPEPISVWRFGGFVGSILAMLLVALLIPFPNRTVHRGYFEYTDARPIYSPEDGTVRGISHWVTEPMSSVPGAGELIVELDNPELALERIDLEHQYLELQSRIEIYRQAQVNDETLAAQIPTLEQMKIEASGKLRLLDEQLAKLRIVSPGPGRFIPKSGWSQIGYSQGEARRNWQPVVTASDERKRIKRGELLGWFTHSLKKEATALVSAETIRSIDTKTRVLVVSDSNPAETIEAKVSYFSSDPIPFFPSELAGDPTYVLQRDERGVWQSDTPLYRVRIELDDAHGMISSGGLCSARFDLPRLTIGQRLWRFIASQFKST